MHFPDDHPDGEPDGPLSDAELASSTEALRHQAAEAQAKPCVGCGTTLCGHEALLNVVLGSRQQARCRACLAQEHGESAQTLAERALQWIVRRDCYRHVWHLAGEAEQGRRADRPQCTFGDDAAAIAAAPPAPTAAARPTATAEHDAGQLGCGELVMQLRFRMLELLPGTVLHVTAHDPRRPHRPACLVPPHRPHHAALRTPRLLDPPQGEPMTNKFCVILTYAKNDSDKATVAFVVANAAVASEKETVVFLSIEAVRLSQQGYADDIAEPGFAPLQDLIGNFVKAGGTVWVCSPCFKRRELDEGKLIAGATIVGGAKLVEFLSQGAASVSF